MSNLLKIKLINLERRPDRLKQFDSQAKLFNLDYERFDAVDGSKFRIDNKTIQIFAGNDFGWRRTVIAIALSHIKLWRELVNSDSQYYLIFEDDVKLDKKFKRYYDSTIEKLKDNNYPFIFLGYHADNDFMKQPFFINKEKNKTVIDEIKYKKHIWGGLFSYIIHRDFAEYLLRELDTNGIKEPIDTFVLHYGKMYRTVPIFCFSEFMTFHNMVDSDIQYDLLSVFDNYDFYQLLDSPGNDLRWVNTQSFDVLKKAADDEENCVAFNTYGFLKSKVCDPKNFIKLPGADSRIHGIYVKRKNNDILKNIEFSSI